MNDFLMDPSRSHEFHHDLSQLHADLSCEYTRLIMSFSFTAPKSPLITAMAGLANCLRGTHASRPELLPATLKKLTIIATQGPRSPLPCLYYSGLCYLLHVLKGIPESTSLRKKICTIQQQIKPQLTELSGSIFILVRVLGVYSVLFDSPAKWLSISFAEVDQLIGVPNGLDVIRQTIDLDLSPHYHDKGPGQFGPWVVPIKLIRQALLRWLIIHQLKVALGRAAPPIAWGTTSLHRMVTRYAWAWPWDTTPLLPNWGNQNHVVHHLDVIECCLHTLFLGVTQPINRIPLGEKGLQFASMLIRSYWAMYYYPARIVVFPRVLSRIDFASLLQALPTLNTELYPRLFYLHHAFDTGYNINHVHMADRDPSLRRCFRGIYSLLVQDPIVSHAIAVIYAMFQRLPPRDIEPLLGLTPGELFNLPAMQALFGVGVLRKDDENLQLPTWLPLCLENGSVKFQHSAPNNYSINDYISNAHEYLAIACIEYLLSCAVPIKQDGPREETIRLYAMRYWTSHLRHAKHSERLFKTLRRAIIHRDDVEPVIEWLEKGTNIPKDILLEWHAARHEHNTKDIGIPDLDRSLFYRYAYLKECVVSIHIQTRVPGGASTR
ncbi:hypothetical protein BD779DRAFT_318194 [Infundibulicybe gibba]|nr:hypothetical protein BD779DRAFT_318194 [Infundibulicybe gibba]